MHERKTYCSILLILALTSFIGSCSCNDSWPPETSGPNLPVRYCDIQKEDKDKAVIGYVFVDTMAVNWMLPNLMKGSRLYRPDISDLRKAERILQKEYPSILEKWAYDKEGYLFQEGGLRNYARQYAFLKNTEGKKYVFVNFVLLKWVDLEDKEPLVYDPNDLTIPPPESHPMSRSFQFVLDGGDGYWRAMLDLDDEKTLWVSVNGHA
jgi:hypothetical protein